MQQIVAANFACTRIATLTPETYIKAVNKCQLLPHSQQKRVQWGENRYHYIQFRRKDEKGAVLSCPPDSEKKAERRHTMCANTFRKSLLNRKLSGGSASEMRQQCGASRTRNHSGRNSVPRLRSCVCCMSVPQAWIRILLR